MPLVPLPLKYADSISVTYLFKLNSLVIHQLDNYLLPCQIFFSIMEIIIISSEFRPVHRGGIGTQLLQSKHEIIATL
jgi:hypothetical protein